MSYTSDLTFITNEENRNLANRFEVLLKNAQSFDVLVGYFYISGFYKLYKFLEDVKKIRILIGIGVDKKSYELVNQAQNLFNESDKKLKEFSLKEVIEEVENSEDKSYIEEGIRKFIEWVSSKKIEIKVYPSQKLHAKLYIMTFKEGDRDKGRVITGSSNFTESGLTENLEFNVELKNRSDYEFAKTKFEDLWEKGVDLTKDYVNTIKEKTWLNDTITPYELYLKFLYEYFKDELNRADENIFEYLPDGFKKLEYQEQAVLNAKRILQEYGGVFISDVVGLGKTYISALLATQLDGRNLVIAPPSVLDENNPGSWRNIFSDFKVAADFKSIGKLDDILKQGVEKYKNVFIDEAHRFRNETNNTYEKLARICRGKRVILITATPFNNRPSDILAQIKLFQNATNSTIPNLPNLEKFFKKLDNRVKDLDRQQDYEKYIKATKRNSKEIREKILKYLMIRRTRREIEKYFAKDLKKEGIKFPEVQDPIPIFYQLNDYENRVFDRTIELITQEFKYARYTAMLYYKYKNKLKPIEIQGQKNMGKFMKILLVKRLESSFYAFKKSIDRFIGYYERFLDEFKKGNVYISKGYANKIFELLENDDYDKIEELILNDKVQRYEAKEFSDSFKSDLESDLNILKEIKSLWSKIDRDPKLEIFIKTLSSDENLIKNKIVIFSESKESVEYLYKELNKKFPNKILAFSSKSSKEMQRKVIENFDANAYKQKDDYKILVTTDILAEGVNLHRSNIVINYDIPWNPTKIMQRVGRVNRIGTKFDKIYIYNFFPTEQSNNQIKLKEAAQAKIEAFIALLGSDAKLLTEDETVESHEIFKKLTSKESLLDEGENEESELKFLQIIKDIRDKNPDLFNKIKNLPKKARTAKKDKRNGLLTYFKKGKLQKFFICSDSETKELDFIKTAKLLKSSKNDIRQQIPSDFYEKLEKNKTSFYFATTEENREVLSNKGRDNALKILKYIKLFLKDRRRLTDEQVEYFKNVEDKIENGAIPKQTLKKVNSHLQKEKPKDALDMFMILQKSIPFELLKSHISEDIHQTSSPREVILSEYLIGG